MKVVEVKIVSTSPLIMDKFSVEMIPKGLKMKTKPVEAPVEDALWQDEEGVFLPNRNLMACLRDGAGRVIERNRTTYRASILGLAQVMPLKIRMTGQKWDKFTRGVRRKNGERIVKTSPCFDSWWLEFQLLIDDSIEMDTVRGILEIAGRMDGLGSSRTWGFGRFKIEKFQES